MSSNHSVLYVLYNADASVMGKLRYACHKVTRPRNSDSVCAACDITHGGLSLHETPSWIETKKQIEDQTSLKVVQWHRDELSQQVKSYVEESKVAYPAALIEEDGQIRVVLDKTDLARCNGDAKLFLGELKSRGIIGIGRSSKV